MADDDAPKISDSRPVASFPVWKRSIAIGWVIFLCVLAGSSGLALANFFSFSAY